MNIAIVDDSREEQQIIHNAVADWAEKTTKGSTFWFMITAKALLRI